MSSNEMTDNMRDEIWLKSHNAISKTMSDLGGDIKDVKQEMSDLKTNVAVIVERLDIFINEIKDIKTSTEILQTSDTEIRTSFRTAKLVTGIFLGALITVTYYAYNGDNKAMTSRIDKIETDNAQVVSNLINLLGDKKKLLNLNPQELRDTIANSTQ